MSALKLVYYEVRVLDSTATGKGVREARLASGKSLRHVAGRLGISATYLSDLERGLRNWTPQLFDRAVAVLEEK